MTPQQIAKKGNDRLLKYLKSDLAQRQAKNPRFSMRSYATTLQLSRSSLSRIMSGQIPISKRTRQVVLEKIKKTNRQEAFEIEELYSEKFERQKIETLDQVKIDVLSEWHHFAILTLMETDDFASDKKWIAKRLGISESQASTAMQNLLSLELIEKSSNGELKSTGKSLYTTHKLINRSIRKYHRQLLLQADKCLANMNEDSFKKTNFSGVMVAVDPARMTEAVRRIVNFQRRLAIFLESGLHKKDVYMFSLSFFPLSKEVSK